MPSYTSLLKGVLYSKIVSQSEISEDTEPVISAELIIFKNNIQTHYAPLKEEKEEIEKEFKIQRGRLIWHEKNKNKSRVVASHVILNTESQNDLHEWLRVHLEKLYKVFAPRIRLCTNTQIPCIRM